MIFTPSMFRKDAGVDASNVRAKQALTAQTPSIISGSTVWRKRMLALDWTLQKMMELYAKSVVKEECQRHRRKNWHVICIFVDAVSLSSQKITGQQIS